MSRLRLATGRLLCHLELHAWRTVSSADWEHRGITDQCARIQCNTWRNRRAVLRGRMPKTYG